MRRLYIILLSIIVCAPAMTRAEKQTSYLHAIGINQGEVAKHGRSVELKMSIDLSKAKIRTQHTVSLTPVLVSEDESREMAFPPIVIDGKTRHKVYLRAQSLESVELPPFHNDEAQVIIRHSRKEQQYDYTASVPYQRWMLDGKMEIREEVHGCTNCEKGEAEKELWNVLPEYFPSYRTDLVAPEPEPVKVRAETRTARLQFRQDSYKIMPKYKNNSSELDTVFNSIDLVKKNPDVKIIGIYITGYASPEGTMEYNMRLSERRAKSFTEYIKDHIGGIDQSLYHVDWKGEDWNELRRQVELRPKLLDIDKVLDIIDNCGDDKDQCEERIKASVSKDTYQRLLNEMYSPIRRNEYRIEYNVRNFNLEEARRMVDERPDLLSLSEMYKVAGSYGKGTPEYDKVMATAVKFFPESPAALNDNAMDAISRKDYAKAVALLEKAEVTARTPELLNTLGVAYSGEGEYHKAEDAFSRAASMGHETAKHNLLEVQKVIDQL